MYLLRNMTLNLAFLSLKKALFTNQFLRHQSLDENGAVSTELYSGRNVTFRYPPFSG